MAAPAPVGSISPWTSSPPRSTRQTCAHYDPSEDELLWDPANVCRRCRRRPRAHPSALSAQSSSQAPAYASPDALPEFDAVIRRLRIPVVTAWTHDLIASDDELFCGRPGTIGERAGNLTVQNSDVLLVLGSRLNIRQTSYNWASFARFAVQNPGRCRRSRIGQAHLQARHRHPLRRQGLPRRNAASARCPEPRTQP